MRKPISAVIITRNEASHIAQCIASVDFCDEVLVVDSGSTDATMHIATARGARVLHQRWLGFGPQKRFAAAQARHDWVLALDADERVTPELRASIEQVMRSDKDTGGTGDTAADRSQPAAWVMARRNRFMGRWLRFGEGYPDDCVRLFDRRRAQWSDDTVHERVLTTGRIDRLDGDLLHDSAESLDDYLAKQNLYSSLQAEAMLADGKSVSAVQVVASPLVRFLKFYLLRQGFRDGLPGLVHIAIGCFASFAKYAKVACAQRRARALAKRADQASVSAS